ncbi:type II toxin-antitoxin system RelE/ParE family toxin [Salinimicrobium sediminilitoris]|uniref:type II toxin-antitoxin system RelE/ParE family toxin n=1 Tax=Salinimicrobium sediminilitoris TaxID=2876715 RepID=UPI001E632C69|nr:type II toxin-antitoxin system RelE/ParE family toxin [Salinimicrobium sediminilitoris]MCC8361077.1 type II toxin-antitoxin system RelE/ParE family toxin [Salinimicrobium sediminilitoris]
MDEIEILWTFTAKAQRDEVFQYWNERNENTNYSRKLNLAIRERLEILRSNPEVGKPTSFPYSRVLILRHYSIIYKINLPKIFITGFWDNRKDPAKLLRFLKKI